MIGRVIHGQIYAIKNKDGEILYIGSTRRINSSKRFAEHMRLIKQKKHKYISYNEYENGLKFELLALVYSDSFIIEFTENLYNSLYCPRNPIISKGAEFVACSKEDAEKSLKGLENAYVICRLDNLDVDLKTEMLMELNM